MNTFFSALALLSSLSVIISVTFQDSSSGGGSSAITGGSEPMWGQSRGSSKQDILKRATIISAAVFIIAHLGLTIIK